MLYFKNVKYSLMRQDNFKNIIIKFYSGLNNTASGVTLIFCENLKNVNVISRNKVLLINKNSFGKESRLNIYVFLKDICYLLKVDDSEMYMRNFLISELRWEIKDFAILRLSLISYNLFEKLKRIAEFLPLS